MAGRRDFVRKRRPGRRPPCLLRAAFVHSVPCRRRVAGGLGPGSTCRNARMRAALAPSACGQRTPAAAWVVVHAGLACQDRGRVVGSKSSLARWSSARRSNPDHVRVSLAIRFRPASSAPEMQQVPPARGDLGELGLAILEPGLTTAGACRPSGAERLPGGSAAGRGRHRALRPSRPRAATLACQLFAAGRAPVVRAAQVPAQGHAAQQTQQADDGRYGYRAGHAAEPRTGRPVTVIRPVRPIWPRSWRSSAGSSSERADT